MSKQASDAVTQPPAGFSVVEVSREPVELYKILKFEGMVGSGGEAKAAVASGQVLLNGEIETQKRKKVLSGDTIEFGEERIWIRLSASVSDDIAHSKANVAKTTATKASAIKTRATENKVMKDKTKAEKKRTATNIRAKLEIAKGSRKK